MLLVISILGIFAILLIILQRCSKKFPKKIKLVIRHGGNQDIDEFKNNNFIELLVLESDTILAVKKELQNQINYSPEPANQHLKLAPFGRRLSNNLNISRLIELYKCYHHESLGNECTLFIVIDNF
jgi:hypothetical protein